MRTKSKQGEHESGVGLHALVKQGVFDMSHTLKARLLNFTEYTRNGSHSVGFWKDAFHGLQIGAAPPPPQQGVCHLNFVLLIAIGLV